MYEYQGALVKHRKPNVIFEELDVRNLSVKTLVRIYAEVYLILLHPVNGVKHTLKLSDAADKIVNLVESTTVQQWLVSNANDTLPTLEGIPKVETHSAMMRDAWQAGFKLDLTVALGSPFNDALDSDKTDIWLRREDTNYVDILEHCLATVNGLVHRLDADGDGLYIKDAGTTFRQSQNAMVGLISFKNLGKIHTATITADMIYQPNSTKLYSDHFYIKVPFDTTDKVTGIVIGGYLHLASSDIAVTGDHVLKVEMRRIPFLERYMTTRYMIDQSSMLRFHEIGPSNKTDYDLQGFYSNECMLELLTLSQSFLVGIEVDHLNTTIHPTGRTGLPGRFHYDERPLYPLRTELGLLPSYIPSEEKGMWVLMIDNNLHQHRFINTRNHKQMPIIDEKRISHQPETFSKGDLVQWSTSSIEIVIPEI